MQVYLTESNNVSFGQISVRFEEHGFQKTDILSMYGLFMPTFAISTILAYLFFKMENELSALSATFYWLPEVWLSKGLIKKFQAPPQHF